MRESLGVACGIGRQKAELQAYTSECNASLEFKLQLASRAARELNSAQVS